MSNQEMQFADPDWKPTQPLQEKTGAHTPEAYRPQPINDDIREQPRQPVAETPSERQGVYAGLPPYASSMPGQRGEGYQFRRPYRRRGRGLWFWLILALLLFSFMGGGLGALSGLGQKTLDDSHSVAVQGIPTIVIHEDNGNIQVHHSGTGNTVLIDALKKTGFFDDPSNIHVNVSLPDANTNTINVTVDTGNNAFSSRRVDFDITVPQGANLQFQVTSGDIKVDGVTGSASLITESGNITTSNDAFSANAVLKTTSGDIRTSQDMFNGQSGISTTSGDISLEQDTLNGSSTIATTSGDIRFNGAVNPDQKYQFQVESGNVDIGLPGNSNFSVDGSTTSGSINTDGFSGLNVQESNAGSGSQVSGQVGTSPGASFTIHTTSGDITIQQNS